MNLMPAVTGHSRWAYSDLCQEGVSVCCRGPIQLLGNETLL